MSTVYLEYWRKIFCYCSPTNQISFSYGNLRNLLETKMELVLGYPLYMLDAEEKENRL